MAEDPPAIPPVTEDEIDAVLAEAQGDPRAAIRMLLHDLASLAHDADRLVSFGFVRGRAPWSRIS
jgi:hypothetical protein